MAGDPHAPVPGYIQVAPDSTGKRMRMAVDSVLQTDGTYLDVYREIVSAPPEWDESERDRYMRRMAEDTLLALNRIADLLTAIGGRTSQGSIT